MAGNKGEIGPAGPPGPPGPQAEPPLLPPELLFQLNEFSPTKGEDRAKRDLEMIDKLMDMDDDELNEFMGVTKPSGRKNGSRRKVENDDLSAQFLDMYSSIHAMRLELERIRKPLGTRDNPARSCKDLYYGHPSFANGEDGV